MISIQITSLVEAEQYVPKPGRHELAIAINSPDSRTSVLHKDFEEIIRATFFDIDVAYEEYPTVFTRDMATRIINKTCAFVEKHVGHPIHILVHCEAGVSRSAAVAAALSKYFLGHTGNIFKVKCPNSRVYRIMSEVLNDRGAWCLHH